ncbi:hypothetical protein PICMEDRAFT_74311 [Pichia membranifaciens NRRL Y-2026]|uniref:Uncharacterized protein n=1 Tax=Pichia membranifaciens NRRL Y-2026 TaxID=763406 RepID=A0A1E3NEL5_9ASCO|nr:hypothetical protein PICMEDRAFT_74311 [Pichia membranifaciens NRRL Y-2026]ODQ44587.1 hypothetical protein PICMEDRAFT_74311 [Pichia membranifaciens NRRL Y-2026]
MFHHTLGVPKPRNDEERAYSIRGRQPNIKSQRTAVGGALCDTNLIPTDNTTNSNPKAQKEERYSLRKLARNLLFNTEQAQEFKDGYGYDAAEYQFNNGSYPYDTHHNYGKVHLDGMHWKNQGYNDEYEDNVNQKILAEDYTSRVANNYVQPVSRDREYTNHVNSKALQKNESIVNGSEVAAKIADNNQDFKIVAITSIPKKMSVSALLTQIYGGPLEKIDLVRKDNYQFYNDESLYKLNQPVNWSEVSIFLHFNKNEDAKSFYQYSKSGLFRVNDVHLKTVWIPNLGEERLYEDDEDETQSREESLLVSSLMTGEEKARRVLVFKRPIFDKKSKLEKKKPGYPDPTINYSEDFDIEEIKKDFGDYGKLVEILPVVSRKLCFGVQYYDVRSAIRVKNVIQRGGHGLDGDELNDQDLELRRKYNGWYVWYGKDPADRAVPS